VGKEKATEALKWRQKLRNQQFKSQERWMIDRKIKSICFIVSSSVFIVLCIGIFLYKRELWFVNVFGVLRIYATVILGVIAGLISGLVIGVGLIANLLISYAHSVEAEVIFHRENPNPAVEESDEKKRADKWEEYKLHIELYKFYLDIGLKANLFFYLITGTILGFYLTHPEVKYKKFSLLLPILISLALGGMFIHAAMLWMRVSRSIRRIRGELNIKKAPDINIMTVLLAVFGFITLTVGFSMVLLVIVT
jgi:hypothetical protein